MDSGATHHVVHDEKVLRNVRKPSTPYVTLGGGETHSVKTEGDLLLKGGPNGSVLLKGVLHVPTLNINLLSTLVRAVAAGPARRMRRFTIVQAKSSCTARRSMVCTG